MKAKIIDCFGEHLSCMDNLLTLYKKRLSLEDATFSLIDHEDAIVAVVYKVTQSTGKQFILKVCEHVNHYLREVYFLDHFANTLFVPRIVNVVQPETNVHGAILMECLPGTLLEPTYFTDKLAYNVGALLARIHQDPCAGYGDLIEPQDLSMDPRLHFTSKFEKGLAESSNHLPELLLKQCHHYYDTHVDLLISVDGPCIIHRDFRPGNLIVNDGEIQGVIDWSSGRGGFAEEDFCSLEHGEWSVSSGSKKLFLEGYASIRPVPYYTAIMPLLRLSKAIASIGFTLRRGTWNNSDAKFYQRNRDYLETFMNIEENEII